VTDANDILMGSGGAPAAKFPTVGTVVTGTVIAEPRATQQVNFRTKAPETWKDGSPKMQVVVKLATNLRDPEKADDNGERDLYIKGKNLTDAIRQAVRQSGANGIHTGGVLTVQYIGDGPTDPNADVAPKLYAASYQPPAVSFNGVTPPAQPAAPASQPGYAPATQPIPAAVVEPCPPGVDPAMWARLLPEQRQAVLAANRAAAPAY
jgi:hypothetical protein